MPSTSVIPTVPPYLPRWLLLKTGGIMWSGLKAAFACRCREGNIRLLLLYLFSVSGGDAINQEREEKYHNNTVVRKKKKKTAQAQMAGLCDRWVNAYSKQKHGGKPCYEITWPRLRAVSSYLWESISQNTSSLFSHFLIFAFFFSSGLRQVPGRHGSVFSSTSTSLHRFIF